jgi:deoxycytidylate deaminase
MKPPIRGKAEGMAANFNSLLSGSTLYTTTFPCHSCARHIIAAGISDVVYIEPYEKSLASDLHNDAIAFDPDESSSKKNEEKIGKVQFIHFEGVAPRQYLNLFLAKTERKDSSGKAVTKPAALREKIIPEYLDNYRDYVSRLV